MENFEPYHNTLGLTGPNELAGTVKYPKTIVATLSNWVSESE